MTIKGLRFKPGKVQVRFGNTEKNQLVVDAEFVDSETITCKTANNEQFGAMAVDVKVSINGEGWTVNKLTYNYFANTAARNCMAFGPGVLANVVFGVEVPFLIQARDTLNERRTSGGDNFTVRIVSADGSVQGNVSIRDLQDGSYEVAYSIPRPGSYLVHVSHADLGGSEAVPIRGSHFIVEAADPWTKHRVLGAIPAKRTVSMGVGLLHQPLFVAVVRCNSSLGDVAAMEGGEEGSVQAHTTMHAHLPPLPGGLILPLFLWLHRCCRVQHCPRWMASSYCMAVTNLASAFAVLALASGAGTLWQPLA